MINAYGIIFVLGTIILTTQRYQLSEFSSLQTLNLQRDYLIEVTQTSDSKAHNSNMRTNYYVIKVMHKEKKQAYLRMQIMFKKVVDILMKEKVIPHSDSLVKSRISPKYLSRKRSWTFTTIFVIFGNEMELQNCYRQLSRLRIHRLNKQPSINYLNEKVEALEVFNSAKERLTKSLDRFPNFQIKDVVEVQITGTQVKNSDIIEIQLQQEFNESQLVISEEQIRKESAEKEEVPLGMKILFRVGRSRSREEDSQDYSYGDSSGQESEEDEGSDESQEYL